ncbi:unnamed protein product [Choristocarpus tenellus]
MFVTCHVTCYNISFLGFFLLYYNSNPGKVFSLSPDKGVTLSIIPLFKNFNLNFKNTSTTQYFSHRRIFYTRIKGTVLTQDRDCFLFYFILFFVFCAFETREDRDGTAVTCRPKIIVPGWIGR